MNVSEVLKKERIALDLEAKSKEEALTALTELLYKSGVLADRDGFMKDVPLKDIKKYRSDLMTYVRSYGQDIISEIDEKRVLTDDLAERIERILTAFEE
mgnify:CR=1 FL=1